MPAEQGSSYQIELQSDLNNFQTCCTDNLRDLKFSKCKVMTLCRVNRITLVNDLG